MLGSIFIVLVLACPALGKLGIFMIGDSTTRELEGAIRLELDCHQQMVFSNESVYGWFHSYSCKNEKYSQIAAIHHWGVSPVPGDYAQHWPSFLSSGDTNSSVHNILMKFQQFQLRSSEDTATAIIFNSNLWDAFRYRMLGIHMQISPIDWASEFQRNYTRVVKHLKSFLRPKDSLYLQVSHAVNSTECFVAQEVHMLNLEIMKVAMKLNLLTIRTDLILGILSKENNYLRDHMHPSGDANTVLAKFIRAHNFE